MNNPDDKIVLNDIYQVVEVVSDAIRHSEANKLTSIRLEDAHKYVSKYCMTEGWGRNVWHTILEDAIRMRRLYEPGEESIDE